MILIGSQLLLPKLGRSHGDCPATSITPRTPPILSSVVAFATHAGPPAVLFDELDAGELDVRAQGAMPS